MELDQNAPIVELSTEGQNVAQILKMAEGDATFAAQPEVKALIDKAQGLATQGAQKQSATENQLSDNGKVVADMLARAATDAEYAAQPEVKALVEMAAKMKPTEETDSEEDEGKEKPKSTFFAKQKTKNIQINTLEDFQPILKKFGVDDVGKFITSAEQWRTDSEQLKDASDENEKLKLLFDQMPQELYDSIQLWGKGKDWKSNLRTTIPSIDFDKEFETQTYKIVNHYFPNKYTQEQIEDTTDVIAQQAVALAKDKFSFASEQFETKRAAALLNAEQNVRALKDSAVSSVDNLKKSFPDFDIKKLGVVKQTLISGDIDGLFRDKKGNYKADAAKRLAMALFGEEELSGRISQAVEKKGKEVSTEVLMDVISRGKRQPTAPQGGEGAQLQQAGIMSELSKLNRTNPYDSRKS